MKKLLLLSFIAISIGIIIPCKVHAFDISAGATTWFVQGYQSCGDLSERSNLSMLYGPVLSAQLSENFNLTFVFLYGVIYYPDSVYKDGYKRMDMDLALTIS